MESHEDKMLEGGFQMSGKPTKPKPQRGGRNGRGAGRGGHGRRAQTGSQPRPHHHPNSLPAASESTSYNSGFRYDRRNQSNPAEREETAVQNLVSKVNAAKFEIF
jgi:hypothetical protein